jgi:hypothetical protein
VNRYQRTEVYGKVFQGGEGGGGEGGGGEGGGEDLYFEFLVEVISRISHRFCQPKKSADLYSTETTRETARRQNRHGDETDTEKLPIHVDW